MPSNGGLFFSADGRRVYLFSGDFKDAAERPALVSANLDGSDRRVIVERNVVGWGDTLLADMKEGGGLCGAPLPNDRALLNIDGPGYANLRTIDLTSGTTTDITPAKGEAFSCSTTTDGSKVAYLYSDFTHPADVYVSAVSAGAAPKQVTDVNAAYLSSVTLSQPVEFTVKDAAGFPVQAWFMPAVGGAPGTKHPTLLDIHGGPETQFGQTFFHEFQLYTSLGYNVVFSDPAGSTGHGYAFEEALENDYGDAMFRDVQAVMDAVVQRPDVDASPLGGTRRFVWRVCHALGDGAYRSL
jgi:dipeptidyl aminopeptidase/acylaminoacyl peptidase